MQGRLRWEPSPVPPASAATKSSSAPRASEESSVKERQRVLSQRIQERDRLRDSTQARLGEKDAFLMHWRWRDEAAERRAHLRIRIKEAQRALIRGQYRGQPRSEILIAEGLLLSSPGTSVQSWICMTDIQLVIGQTPLSFSLGMSTVVEKLDGLVRSVPVRATEVAAAKDKLTSTKDELLVHHFPDLLQAQLLSSSNILSELHRQRQLFVRQLRVVLPLQSAVVESPDIWDGSERVTQVVRVCGFRLPEDDNPLLLPPAELAVALGQGSASQSRRYSDTLSDALFQKQVHRDLNVKPRVQMLDSSTPRARADHQQGVDDHKRTSKSHAEELKRQKDVAYEAWKQAEAARCQEETHFEGWDLIESPYLPPPPSEEENVEHWARAMFIDITK
eukprot:SM000014S00271  [mRNA]  locus=s14:320958:325033:- [translate_table: standard]